MTQWYEQSGGEADVIVSTRVRLARNLTGYPFPARMRAAQRRAAAAAVREAVLNENAATAGSFSCMELDALSKSEAVSLVERHLVTPDFISDAARGGCALLFNGDESLCVMVNGGDHIRLRSMAPGLDLEGAYRAADRLESLLGKVLPFSFHPQLGYLSQDPSNLGTGMHASLMLHLPGLAHGGAIERVAAGLQRLGLQLAPSAAESEADMFLLSNRVTMGLSEGESMANLKSLGVQLAVQERAARAQQYNTLEAQDVFARSLGILQNARMLQNGEFLGLISNLRCGVAMGFITGLPYESIATLIVRVQPATLNCARSETLDRQKRDALRAGIVSQTLRRAATV